MPQEKSEVLESSLMSQITATRDLLGGFPRWSLAVSYSLQKRE